MKTSSSDHPVCDLEQTLVECLCGDFGRLWPAHLKNVDWKAVLSAANRNRTSPLLYARLAAFPNVCQVPRSILESLRLKAINTAARGAALYGEFSSFARTLQSLSIPFIALKGVYLAEIVYQSWALRAMGDIDVLVRKDDLHRAAEGLRQLGYHSKGIQENGELRSAGHHLSPFLRPGSTPVELHWTLRLRAKVDIDGLWQRSEIAKIGGETVRVLSPEDLVLHLCLHASCHHSFSPGLIAIYDIDQVIRMHAGGLQWHEIVRRARQWRVSRGLFLSLRLARDLMHAPIPEDVLTELEPADCDERTIVTAKTHACLLHDMLACTDPPPQVCWRDSWTAGALLGSRSWYEKLRIAIRAVFPSPAAIREHYELPFGTQRVWLYYPLVLFSTLAKAWHFVLNISQQKRTTVSDRHTNLLRLQSWIWE